MPRSKTDVVFVIDEDAGPHVLAGIVDAGGAACLLIDKVPRGTENVLWIPRVREWGHAIITRDVAMRRNPAEEYALRSCGVHVFILRAGGACFDELRALAKQHFNTMFRHVCTQATPYVAHVTRNGVDVRFGGGRLRDPKRKGRQG